MTDPAATLHDLATVVSLLRDKPEAVDEQKAAFKSFAQALGGKEMRLALTRKGFLVGRDDVPFQAGPINAMHAQLAAHRIGELRIPPGLMTSTLLSLVRSIAAPAGTYGSFDHLVARLDAAGAGVVQVRPLDPAILEPEPNVESPPEAEVESPPEEGKEDDGEIRALGPDALNESRVGLMHFATLELHAISPLDETVNRLGGDLSSAEASDLLNELVASAEVAARQREWVVLLRAAYSLLELESKGGEMAEHRGYGIALRRMLPRSALEHIARLVPDAPNKVEAVAVLKRMGADATEVLLHEMATSDNAGERRAYFNALKEMTEGTNLLIHMLSHDDWFVVRNVADLAGEIHLEAALPQLSKHMSHRDERVRRAIAAALGKIGGNGAAEALRRALKDPAASVRLQAAANLDGRRSQGLATTLAMAAEGESKADVQREMLLALGRIGSRDAINALTKAAQPGGKVFKRKSVANRLAAIEGLHIAGPSAANSLKSFLSDEEKEIRDAAQKAITTIWGQ